MTTRAENATADIELRLLLEAIYLRFHYDFRGYAMASLKRRLTTAMGRFGCTSLSQLQDRLLHDPTLFPQLLDFMTVQVSEMFRDPDYYASLRSLYRQLRNNEIRNGRSDTQDLPDF